MGIYRSINKFKVFIDNILIYLTSITMKYNMFFLYKLLHLFLYTERI